jgi:CMP-N,N'-diacetyllegionaminic acid synthase
LKILGIIPARGGSKGLKRKNILPLGKKPLLQYTCESAKNSKLLSKVILSSEDEEIIEVAKELGLEVPFKRPNNLAQDTTTSLEVVKHALQYFKEKGESFDAVCLLQPTTPFRESELIDKAIQKFISDSPDSLVSVREVPHEYNPHWIFEEKEGRLSIATGEKEIITRRQELPKAYFRDGAIYLTKTSMILDQNSLYGKNIGFIDTTDSPYVNIDTPSDWEKAESILNTMK